jgi:hypothetical protein
MVVEDVPRLDLAEIKALPSWPEFKRRREVTIAVTDIEVVVRLVTDSTTLGMRWWLVCPECSSRRMYLHLLHGRLACRCCLGLLYFRQAIPDTRWRSEVARPAFASSRHAR